MIMVIGSKGSMGLRYMAILNYLKKAAMGVDKETTEYDLSRFAQYAHGFIVATPTDTHCDVITQIAKFKKPILCEKPIAKTREEIDYILQTCFYYEAPLKMMMQYQILDSHKPGQTHYDYYRTGNDGLKWDCMQLIALARTSVSINNQSPFWECTLNGTQLKLEDINHAYVKFVEGWFKTPRESPVYLQNIHDKVFDYGKINVA